MNIRTKTVLLNGLLLIALSTSLFAGGSRPGAAQPPLNPADFSVFSEEDVMKVFLLVGQSNMKGRGSINMEPKTHPQILFFHMKKEQWYVARDPLHAQGTPDLIDGSDNAGTGPGMSFAVALLENKPDMSIGLVPAAKGGAGINLYRKQLYDRSLKLVEGAREKSKIKVEVKGILWLQGESDSTEERYKTYETKLLSVVDNYRKGFGNPDLPFIACTIGSFIEPHKKFNRTKEINEILLSLPSKRENTACIDARDLTGHIGDRVHYSTESQLEIGKRFAAAYLKLTGSK